MSALTASVHKEWAAQISEQFGAAQILLLLVAVFWFLRLFKSAHRESQFRSRPAKPSPQPHPRSEKEAKRDRERLLLGGFAFTGQAHEILGVSKDANELEIRRAHRALIKRFHPDKIGRPGSREWHEAQKIAESLNTARDQLLKTLRERRPSS
ncbi:MAG: DnaJ domain [Pseudomonadota bacterium]|jgi:hypothetical protein